MVTKLRIFAFIYLVKGLNIFESAKAVEHRLRDSKENVNEIEQLEYKIEGRSCHTLAD